MARILAGTSNPHKLQEIRGLLGPLGIDVIAPAEVGGLPDIPETGKTFAANARLKAMAAAGMKNRAAFAEDSGLEVFALGGEPGVYSARYAGPQATDAERIAKLLDRLKDQPDRSARFVCVVAVATPRGVVGLAEGEVRGRIAERPAGTGGFGYDPVFVPEGHDRTFGEMPQAEKDKLSHRARALQNAVRQGLFKQVIEDVLLEDPVTAAPAAPWRWCREHRDGWWILDGALQVKALPGTLWKDANNARNVLLRPAPGRPAAAEVTVTNDPEVDGEQAGLVWYGDDDHYVKLVKEHLHGEVWVVMAREVGGIPEVVGKVPVRDATVTLRFEARAGRLAGRFRVGGGDWQAVGETTLQLPGAPEVGLVAHGAASDDSARRAQFRLFRFVGLE